MCDVFTKNTPRVVSAVVQLRRRISLSVQTPTVAEQSVSSPTKALSPSSPDRQQAEDLPTKDILAADLDNLLSGDTRRAEALMLRGILHRAERRLRIRMDDSSGARRADRLHIRTISSPGVPKRARPRRMPPKVRVRASVLVPPRKEFARPNVTRRSSVSPNHEAIPRVRWRTTQWEFARVALGALVLCGIVAGLASAGELIRVGRDVRTTARVGSASLLSGVRALLTVNAAHGNSRFSEARGIFEQAQRQLDESTTILQRLAGSLDPLGRMPAARTLLDLGERAAVVGENTALLLRDFQDDTRTLTETLEAAVPRLRTIEGELKDITRQLAGLSTVGWPTVDAAQAREITAALTALHGGLSTFLQSETVVLELLGSQQDRQYLILFENNRELRPTGGFIGSFALIDVARGEVRNIQVDSIYDPDGQLKDFIVPPVPLQKITDRWYARDANWFADFRASATKVATFFERSGGPTVDGVIAVTPTILEDLLQLTGPIPMPAYQVTITAENIVTETQRLVTYDYDRKLNQPKTFIADLLPQILARVATLPRQQWGALLDMMTNALDRKHLLVYLRDPIAEEAVIHLGWGGVLPVLRPPSPTAFQDHVGRVEANIGGHKTDLLIEQEAEYDMTVGSDGALEATLVVTRHHRGSKSGTPGLDAAEDPLRKVNIVYERTFVPLGSTLVDARGFSDSAAVPAPYTAASDTRTFTRDAELRALEENERPGPGSVTVSQESGFTVFGGWLLTNPEETTVTVLRYRLPFRLPRPALLSAILHYELLITQQPGHLPVLTRATVRLPEGFRVAWAAPTSVVTLGGTQKVAFAASVDRDVLWGVVFEER